MGNQHSSDGDIRHARPFARGGGALGLSKSELDKRCQPSGLYESCQWDDRTIRKLIGDGRLAARLKGGEDRDEKRNQECPICFLTYSEVNVTKCCQANICTECFLQVRPQREKQACCPFCNNEKLSIAIAEQLSADQVQEREKEEQLVVEARIRALSNDGNKKAGSPTGDFGDRLQKDERVARMRARSESIHSEENNPNADNTTIQSLAMTPEERRSLEDEMKAQLSHPLARRMEQEAAEKGSERELDEHNAKLQHLKATFKKIKKGETKVKKEAK